MMRGKGDRILADAVACSRWRICGDGHETRHYNSPRVYPRGLAGIDVDPNSYVLGYGYGLFYIL